MIAFVFSCLCFILSGCEKKRAADSTISMDVIDISSLISDNSVFDEETCIDNIITDKATSATGLNDELEKLKISDNELFDKTEDVLDYWDIVNADDFVNESLPIAGIPGDSSLCIVVMGFQLNPDGTMREELIGRLQTAFELALEYPSSHILVTGGGTASANASATEADCMAKWLIEGGIEENRIIIENSSLTTIENALFSNRILKNDYPEIGSVVIVTSDYHIPLSCLLFNATFIWSDDINSMEDTITVVNNYAFDTGRTNGFTVQSQGDMLKKIYSGI